MQDFFNYRAKCNIRIFRKDSGEVLFETHNVIVTQVKWLFAQMMANVNPTDPAPPYALGHTVKFPVWGLALGAGSSNWAPENQPQETPTQQFLFTEFLRKPLDKVNFVDSTYNPQSTLSTFVDFQTVVNATTDGISQSIREMGLIGGGSSTANAGTGSNMMTAQYFNGNPSSYETVAQAQDTVVLINYKTLPPLNLPQGVDIIFSWVLAF